VLPPRTISYARSTEKLEEHLELLRCYYNFVRPHRALRFGREIRTPAMQAGLTTRRLTFKEIFAATLMPLLSWSDALVFADSRRPATDTVIQMPLAA
jgi:hypothetical protein